MPVSITDNANGLLSADLTITYDNSLIHLSNSLVTLSSYLSGLGWSLSDNVIDSSGTAYISIDGTHRSRLVRRSCSILPSLYRGWHGWNIAGERNRQLK